MRPIIREPHHLQNAPIREAVIDIFVEFPKETDRATQLKLLQSLCDKVSANYPTVQNVAEAQFEFNLKQNQARFEGNVSGYRCFNSDKNRIVQFRLDGFTANWLRPYSEWKDFRNMASEMWQLYQQIAVPTKVVKLGVRYINDLTLPTPFENFGEYLVSDPIIPQGLPQGVSRFLNKLHD